MIALITDCSRRKADRIGILRGAHAGNERDVEGAVNIDGQIAQVDVDPIAGALDLREGAHKSGKTLQNTVDTTLIGRQGLNGGSEGLNVLVQSRL